jgi:hypothetical protein
MGDGVKVILRIAYSNQQTFIAASFALIFYIQINLKPFLLQDLILFD